MQVDAVIQSTEIVNECVTLLHFDNCSIHIHTASCNKLRENDIVNIVISHNPVKSEYAMFGTVYKSFNNTVFVSCGGMLSKFDHAGSNIFCVGDVVYIHLSKRNKRKL